MLTASGDLAGDLGDILFVQGFRDQNYRAAAFFLDGIVQCPDRPDSQALQPLPILAKGSQQLGVFRHGLDSGWGTALRVMQDETIPGTDDLEPLQIAGGGHHVPLMVIAIIIQLIKCYVILLPIRQQQDFVVIAFAFEICFGFCQRDFLAAEWLILINPCAHIAIERG